MAKLLDHDVDELFLLMTRLGHSVDRIAGLAREAQAELKDLNLGTPNILMARIASTADHMALTSREAQVQLEAIRTDSQSLVLKTNPKRKGNTAREKTHP